MLLLDVVVFENYTRQYAVFPRESSLARPLVKLVFVSFPHGCICRKMGKSLGPTWQITTHVRKVKTLYNLRESVIA